MVKKMTNSDYWKLRYLQLKKESISDSQEMEKELSLLYKSAQKEMHSYLTEFVDRYGTNGQLDKASVLKELRGQELSNWKYSLKEWERMAKEGGHTTELNAEYYKSRVSRMAALETQLRNVMANKAEQASNKLGDGLGRNYENTYYRNIFHIQKDKHAVVSDFARINERQMKQIISQNWQGSNFSERIWKSATNILPKLLSDSLTRGAALGYGVDKLTKQVNTVIKNYSETNLHRLINTEYGHIAEQATLDSYKETGVEQYEYLATLESNTCDVCAKLDGKIYDVKNKKDGVDYPLIHPNCRCTTVPYYGDVKDEKRWSRNPDTGRGEIIDGMSFKQWSDKVGLFTERDFGKGFVDMKSHIKGKTSAKLYKDTINRTRRLANEDPNIRDYVAKHGLKVGFEDDISTSYAVTEWGKNYPKMEINYNNKRFGRKNLHRKAIEGDIDAGWLMNIPKNQALNYIPTHEMGHVLHNVLFEKHNPDLPNTKFYRNDWIDGVFDKVYNEATKKTGMTSRELNDLFVSGYGKHNKREWFAEMYAEMKLSDGNPLTEAFKKVLREL